MLLSFQDLFRNGSPSQRLLIIDKGSAPGPSSTGTQTRRQIPWASCPLSPTQLYARRHIWHVRISENDALRSLVNGFDVVIGGDICDYGFEVLHGEPAAGTSEHLANIILFFATLGGCPTLLSKAWDHCTNQA